MRAAWVLVPLALVGATGCRFIKRDEARYRDDTSKLLETNNAKLKDCYDGVLRTEKSAAGSVVVTFKVKEETGEIFSVVADDAKSSAPGPVRECVVQSITGLKLDPPDAVEGHATYTYEFEIAPQKGAEPTESGFTTGS
jgi:hypothetical protein